jgi:hypothetical protein
MNRQRDGYASWFPKPKRRRLKDELRECREADAARTAAGTQSDFLDAMCHPAETKQQDWSDKYFKLRETGR